MVKLENLQVQTDDEWLSSGQYLPIFVLGQREETYVHIVWFLIVFFNRIKAH